MKKSIKYLLISFVIIQSFMACSKDDDGTSYDPKWRAENELYFFNMRDSTDYTRLVDPSSNNEYIWYKVLKQGDGLRPYFTDSVNVTYKGWLINDSIFDQTEGSRYEYTGRTFYIGSGTIVGWRLALQNMQVGSQWQIVVPWSLGYGANGSGDIPPYSTLIFELELKSIINRE